MNYLGFGYKVKKHFKGRYHTWHDIIKSLSDKESINFAIEVIQKENLEFEEIEWLLGWVIARVIDVCYSESKTIACSIEVGDIEKIKETIDDKKIEFKNEEEKNKINSLLYIIFSCMSEENIRRAVKEDRECWAPNEMVYSMAYDWVGNNISCEEKLDIILKNIEKIDFNKSEESIIRIIADIDGESSVIQKYFEKFRQYLSKETIDSMEEFIKGRKWNEHEEIVSGIEKVVSDVSLSVNEKMKELEKHINIMSSEDIFRICCDCSDDIIINILNKYPNKINRIDTLRCISELKKESRYSINVEKLNLYKRDIEKIYELDFPSSYIDEEAEEEYIQSFKDMVISKSISGFPLLMEDDLQEIIEYADDTTVLGCLYFTTKEQINRVNEEISNNNPKKAEILAWMMSGVIDADVKQLLKDIDKKVAKEIYCDYYFNLYMLSEKDEMELRDYFEIEDEQVLEEADEDYIEDKYYNLKDNVYFLEKKKIQDDKRITISQIREIIQKIQEEEFNDYTARDILTEFLKNMNSDDIVEVLKNDIEEEMARTIYGIMKRELIPPYKLSHDKRRELEEYFYRGEMVNEKWKNDENPKEGELEEGEDLNKDEKIISSEKLGCEHISEESQTEDDKKDVGNNRKKKYDTEYSEEEKLNLLFDNQEKYTPEDIKNEITRLSGSYMVEGYRTFKNLFSEEEKQEIEEEILEFIEDNNNTIESEKIKEIILSLSNNGIEKGYERFGKYLDGKDREEVQKRLEEIKDDIKEKIKEKNGILKGVKKFLANLLSKSKE